VLRHGARQRVLSRPAHIATCFLALLPLRRLFVGEVDVVHTRHVHLEVALVGEEVLAVTHRTVRLVRPRRRRLRPVVLVRRRRPFLAR
jgi:hypothetical protein